MTSNVYLHKECSCSLRLPNRGMETEDRETRSLAMRPASALQTRSPLSSKSGIKSAAHRMKLCNKISFSHILHLEMCAHVFCDVVLLSSTK
ncbi:hypothetical protein FKM82_016028 [Ascaphus truei]